jgi:hypothetical protein
LHGGGIDGGCSGIVKFFDDRTRCALGNKKVDASNCMPCSKVVRTSGRDGRRLRLSMAIGLTNPAFTGGTAVGLSVQK